MEIDDPFPFIDGRRQWNLTLLHHFTLTWKSPLQFVQLREMEQSFMPMLHLRRGY